MQVRYARSHAQRHAGAAVMPEVRVIGVAEGALNAFDVAFREVLPAARQKFGGGGDDSLDFGKYGEFPSEEYAAEI